MANEQNLTAKPIRTSEEAVKRGRAGGKKSGEVRREKKLMSSIYADYLAKEHDITVNGEKKKISGDAMLAQVMSKILARGDSSSVSLMKEIREATEGNKTTISNPDGSPLIPQKITFEIVDPNDPQHPNSESIPGSSDPGKV